MFEHPSKICIVSDLDGTLLPPDKVPLKRDLDAIRRFEAAGGMFSIATGRTIQAAVRYQQELGLHYPMIVYNGAAIYDAHEERVLFSETLPDEAREITGEILEAHPNVGVEVLRAEATYVVRNTEYEKKHIALCGVEPCYCSLNEIPAGNWLKVLFAMTPEEIPSFIADIQGKQYCGVDFIQSADIFYEMMPHNVTKGSALTAYRNLPGMEGKTFVAVGDYNNDIAMLRAADFSAVPANAVPAAKAAANLVLRSSCLQGAMEELISYLLSKR